MDIESIEEILKIALIITVMLIFGLIVLYIFLKLKNSKEVEKKKEQINKVSETTSMNKQSIFNFMGFDSIKDSMIIQKNGTKYLMIVECQGVNYDLMSNMEKISVEEGFIEFLNTLRYPIQIYIQTRSVNLEKSLNLYKERVKKSEDKLTKIKEEYNEMIRLGRYSEKEINQKKYELTRQNNLVDYGKDIIYSTERISLNKNVLSKNYYIVVSCYISDLDIGDMNKEEIHNLVFAELYTRAQSIISGIASCEIRGRILKTDELVNLLYISYNRDEAELFELSNNYYDELYTTAPDVLDKKMEELDEIISKRAKEKAREKINEVLSEKKKRVNKKMEHMDELVNEMAKVVLEENKKYLKEEIIKEAVKKVEKDKEMTKKNVK